MIPICLVGCFNVLFLNFHIQEIFHINYQYILWVQKMLYIVTCTLCIREEKFYSKVIRIFQKYEMFKKFFSKILTIIYYLRNLLESVQCNAIGTYIYCII